jgi:MSHA pilin protein MshD
MPANKSRRSRQKGFTLIEVVASMVVTALAFTALASFFFNQSTKAIEPIFETRAAKLGEALMDEILSRPFDEATPVGGVPACDEVGAPICTTISDLGTDTGEVDVMGDPIRIILDDVDDYDDYCDDANPVDVEDALGNLESDAGNALEDFGSFKMSICVGYDGNYNDALNEPGAGATEFLAKLITINIFPPAAAGLGPPIEFKAYRGNF